MGLMLKPGTSWWETYARCVSVAPEAFDSDRLAQPDPWRVAPGRHARGPRHSGRRHTRSPARRGSTTTRRSRPSRTRAASTRIGPRSISTSARCRVTRGRRCHDRAPRPARPAAGLGDRQAVAPGLRRRRPLPRRRAMVRRARSSASWRSGHPERTTPAARAGLQHRQLELPDERAGPRRVGAAAGRQRGGREDPEPGRVPHPHAGPRTDAAGRAAGHAAVRGRRVTWARPSSAATGSARWPSSAAAPTAGEPACLAGRHRPPPHARAGGAERLGHLGFLAVAPAGPAPPEGLRVRQAALHRLPPLRRPAPAVPGFPGDVPPGHPVRSASATRWRSTVRRRPAARTGLRPGHPRHQGRRPGRRSWTRPCGAAVSLSIRGSVGDGTFLDGQDTSAYVAPGLRPPAAGVVVAAPRRTVRADRLGRRRRHRVRAAGRHERQQRLAGRQHRHRRHGLRAPGSPSSCRRSRWGSTSPAAGATARRSSAGSATPGRAPSSAATCWSRP